MLVGNPSKWPSFREARLPGPCLYQASSRREAERLYTTPMMKKLNVVFLLATVALVGGGLWFVLRPGRHFDPSLWGNPATSASAVLGATWFKRAAPRKFPSGPYPFGA